MEPRALQTLAQSLAPDLQPESPWLSTYTYFSVSVRYAASAVSLSGLAAGMRACLEVCKQEELMAAKTIGGTEQFPRQQLSFQKDTTLQWGCLLNAALSCVTARAYCGWIWGCVRLAAGSSCQHMTAPSQCFIRPMY